MSLYEDDFTLRVALSALLDDTLSLEEAAALRERIANEPAVALLWAEMKSITTALDDLPDAMTPPPELDAAVVETLTAASAPRSRPISAAGWRRGLRRWVGVSAIAAAAATMIVMWPGEPASVSQTITLLSGEQLISGEAVSVMAAGVPIEISGRARIQLEPAGQGVRTPKRTPTEVDDMRNFMLGAGAGAVLTVVVYEGFVRVVPEAGAGAVTLSAGEQQQFTSDASSGMTRERARPSARAQKEGTALSAPARVVELESQVEALEEEVAALRLERNLQKGALEAVEGTPQEWPDSVPSVFQQAVVSERLDALTRDNPDLEVLSVDCEEYPCIALLRDYSSDAEWWNRVKDDLTTQWSDAEDVGLGMYIHMDDPDPAKSTKLAGIVLRPGEDERDGVNTRSEWRANNLLKETADELQAQAQGE